MVGVDWITRGVNLSVQFIQEAIIDYDPDIAKDIIPNKFHSKIGGAFAMSNQNPSGGGSFIGWEANTKLSYDLGAFLSVEMHAAYMGLGDFYDSKAVNGNLDSKPANPWTTGLGLKWLIF